MSKKLKGLYAITDELLTPLASIEDNVAIALENGVGIIQYRDKTSSLDVLRKTATVLQDLCKRYDALFVLNDHIDLAIEIGCDGLHIGKSDHTRFEEIRKVFDGIIGVSCYGDVALAKSFQDKGADYVAFGSFFTSKTKPNSNRVPLDVLTQAKKELHIAWCVIDSKSIEKVLPSLSEIGVGKISFIFCDRSQKNFKLDFKRYERILEASMQQCGRSSYIEFDTYKNIAAFIAAFPDTKVFDFCDRVLENGDDFKRVLIGCEGGFSQNEKELLKAQEVFRLNTPMVLRSESAVMAVASKILL